MLKRLALVVLLVALVAGSADANIHRGKRGRRYCRRQGLVLYLQSDALKIYEQYGYPIHRLRILEFVIVDTERLSYRFKNFFCDRRDTLFAGDIG